MWLFFVVIRTIFTRKITKMFYKHRKIKCWRNRLFQQILIIYDVSYWFLHMVVKIYNIVAAQIMYDYLLILELYGLFQNFRNIKMKFVLFIIVIWNNWLKTFFFFKCWFYNYINHFWTYKFIHLTAFSRNCFFESNGTLVISLKNQHSIIIHPFLYLIGQWSLTRFNNNCIYSVPRF